MQVSKYNRALDLKLFYGKVVKLWKIIFYVDNVCFNEKQGNSF